MFRVSGIFKRVWEYAQSRTELSVAASVVEAETAGPVPGLSLPRPAPAQRWVSESKITWLFLKGWSPKSGLPSRRVCVYICMRTHVLMCCPRKTLICGMVVSSVRSFLVQTKKYFLIYICIYI